MEVIEKLRRVQRIEETKLVSLDVEDMFINIPVEKAIALIKDNCSSQFHKKKTIILLVVCFRYNYFRFNNKYCI